MTSSRFFLNKVSSLDFELFISFDVHKGKFFARYLYDVDENGEYEKVCFDIDLDEKVDQCKLIT